MSFTPYEITILTFFMFTFIFEYALMDKDEGFNWFTPSYYINHNYPVFIAWLFVILISTISPVWALLKILRWLFGLI